MNWPCLSFNVSYPGINDSLNGRYEVQCMPNGRIRNDEAKKSRVATSASKTHHDTISNLPLVDPFADRDNLTSSVRARDDLYHIILYDQLMVESLLKGLTSGITAGYMPLRTFGGSPQSAIPITLSHSIPTATSLKLRDTALTLTKTSPWPGCGVFASFASWSESIPSPFGTK